jgi:hypothetical protein
MEAICIFFAGASALVAAESIALMLCMTIWPPKQ